LRQTFCERLPGLTGILGAVHRELLVHVVTAHRIFDDDEDGLWMVNVQSDRKPEGRGQVLLNIYPFITGVRRLVNAAMVLLIEDIGFGGMLDEPVNALAELRILVRQEIGAGILVGKDPALAAIVCAHTAYGRDAHPHAGGIERVGYDGMQAESSGTRFPATTGRVGG
jgi:hypothetical protein